MKTPVQSILIFLTGIAFLGSGFLLSCNKEDPAVQNTNGKLINISECKSGKSSVADTFSCVEYTFEPSSGKLLLKHVNSAFNCCPLEVTCTFSIVNDTIIIEEMESEPACNCDCLYDLDIEISGITAKIYRLKFIEPYLGDQEPLDFYIDIPSEPAGIKCVSRSNYPWN